MTMTVQHTLPKVPHAFIYEIHTELSSCDSMHVMPKDVLALPVCVRTMDSSPPRKCRGKPKQHVTSDNY